MVSSSAQESASPAPKHTGDDRYGPRADCEDIDWLRKLRNAKASNHPLRTSPRA